MPPAYPASLCCTPPFSCMAGAAPRHPCPHPRPRPLCRAANAVLPDAIVKQLGGIVTALNKALAPISGGSTQLQSLWSTLFWVSVGLAAVVVLHAAIRALVIWRRWRMPLFFEVRRGRAGNAARLLGTTARA